VKSLRKLVQVIDCCKKISARGVTLQARQNFNGSQQIPLDFATAEKYHCWDDYRHTGTGISIVEFNVPLDTL